VYFSFHKIRRFPMTSLQVTHRNCIKNISKCCSTVSVASIYQHELMWLDVKILIRLVLVSMVTDLTLSPQKVKNKKDIQTGAYQPLWPVFALRSRRIVVYTYILSVGRCQQQILWLKLKWMSSAPKVNRLQVCIKVYVVNIAEIRKIN